MEQDDFLNGALEMEARFQRYFFDPSEGGHNAGIARRNLRGAESENGDQYHHDDRGDDHAPAVKTDFCVLHNIIPPSRYGMMIS